MEYFIVGDEDAVLGFGMVGVQGLAVKRPEEAERAFRQALARTEIGIILMTEHVAELIRPLVDEYIFTADFPLIVEIPDRRGRIEGKPALRETVNRAIGITL